jgi:hypothetical protein
MNWLFHFWRKAEHSHPELEKDVAHLNREADKMVDFDVVREFFSGLHSEHMTSRQYEAQQHEASEQSKSRERHAKARKLRRKPRANIRP